MFHHPNHAERPGVPHVQLLDWVMDVHVVMQRQVPTIQKIQKTARMGPLIDEVADIPFVKGRQVPTRQNGQKSVEVPQVEIIDMAVDVAVAMQRQVPTFQWVQRTLEFPSWKHSARLRLGGRVGGGYRDVFDGSDAQWLRRHPLAHEGVRKTDSLVCCVISRRQPDCVLALAS